MPRRLVNPLLKVSVATAIIAAALVGTAVRPAPAQAATPCWKLLLNDWYDGRIDQTYPVHCYREALKHLPSDVQTYSSAHDDILRALQSAIAEAAHRAQDRSATTRRSRRRAAKIERRGRETPAPVASTTETGADEETPMQAAATTTTSEPGRTLERRSGGPRSTSDSPRRSRRRCSSSARVCAAPRRGRRRRADRQARPVAAPSPCSAVLASPGRCARLDGGGCCPGPDLGSLRPVGRRSGTRLDGVRGADGSTKTEDRVQSTPANWPTASSTSTPGSASAVCSPIAGRECVERQTFRSTPTSS